MLCLVPVPFEAHIELLRGFLDRRAEILERIQGLLNAQRKPASYQQDQRLLSRHFEDCFSTESRLRRQLDEAHWASGFKPRETPGLHNDLVDPGEMMVRAFHLWRQTFWPGRSGRERYALTLFNLYILRRLTLLSMRLWDDGADKAGDRLTLAQAVLDRAWSLTPADHPVLVRDLRWLIPVAQSPTTDELFGYFNVAKCIAESFSENDRLEILKAGVRMAGGHLRSQLRHISVQKGLVLDDHRLVLSTRRSNALDFALLIQGLVPLLDAYERASIHGDPAKRVELADTICQGISPDPELFLNRLDLLGPYSMIEHLFITMDGDGHAAYTPMGERHVQLVQQYEARIHRLAKTLHDDCRQFKPVDGAYSPYGVLYGFSSNLLEHMAFKSLQPDAVTAFSLEDIFTAGGADKRSWVRGWRKLPHVQPEMAKLFEYPQQFAEEIFARLEAAFRRASNGETKQPGRVDVPMKYFRSSDKQLVAEQKAEPYDQKQLLHERMEGEFLVSYQTSGGWVAVTKDVLSEGVDITDLPREAAEVLRLMRLRPV